MRQNTKGFTLMELLVVIAIIGILATVVLASLSSARTKAGDAAIKSNLDTIRKQAAIYYNGTGNGSYGQDLNNTSACATTANTVFTLDSTVLEALQEAVSKSGATPRCAIAVGDAYALAVRFASDTTKWWCIDSNGSAKEWGGTVPPNFGSATAVCQ